MKKDKEVKTIQNGGKLESRSRTGSRILQVTSEVPWEVVLRDLVFFFFIMSHAALFCTHCNWMIWSAGRPVKTELQ